MPIVLDGTNGITATAMTAGESGILSLNGSYISNFDSDGLFTAGTTYTPALVGSNWKYITNGGAFTIAAPASAGSGQAYTMIVYVQNVANAGSISMTGFNKVTGDLFTTTLNHVFFIFINVFGDGAKIANVVAAQ